MTKTKSNMMTDFVAPIAVLVIICAVMSALLALTNDATAPIIAAAERQANEAARLEVMPDADGFEEVVMEEGLPDAITGVYRATNGVGYVFSLTTTGYGGKNTLKMTVGIDMDGAITGTKVLSHAETAGLGSKITTDAFKNQFPGKDASYVSSIDNLDTISGATRSSNFYRLALVDAFEAYAAVTG